MGPNKSSVFIGVLTSSPLCISIAVRRQMAEWNLVLSEVGP